MRSFGLFLFALSFALTSAAKLSTCRTTKIYKNFDISRILGTWYANSWYRHDFEEGCDCYTSEISAVDANTIEFYNCCQMPSFSNQTQNCEIGMKTAYLINPAAKEANFNYIRVGSPVESRVWIVDTDYDTYMIANGCDLASVDEENETFWVMTRDKEIDAIAEKKVNVALEAQNFEKIKILNPRQDGDYCQAEKPKRVKRQD